MQLRMWTRLALSLEMAAVRMLCTLLYSGYIQFRYTLAEQGVLRKLKMSHMNKSFHVRAAVNIVTMGQITNDNVSY